MFDLEALLAGGLAILALALATWLVSVGKRDASIMDPVWPLLFVAAAFAYAETTAAPRGPRTVLVLLLVCAWGLRLSAYLFWRAWGEPEDRRYQRMRRRAGTGFWWKSLFIVFLLQAALAWIVSLPLLAGVDGARPLGWLDLAGVGLWSVGFVFESVGDWQLLRFRADPRNAGRVLDTGLWRYTRHPNYFGDFCVWWGLYLVALAAGGWWSLPGPLVMSFLLMRVSGVPLLERDLAQRRPDYRRYVERTSAFFPRPPRRG